MTEQTSIPTMFGFQKDEKSKSIPLSLLQESVRVEDNLGRAYRTRPIQAWSFLTMIVGMLKEAEIGHKVHPIIVRADSSGVALNDIDRADNKYSKAMCPVNKWIFDQLITKIDIPHIGNDDVNGAIALSYTKRGISVAFGLNVSVCDNLCVMGGQQMRTYKHHQHDALAWESMKIQLRDWIGNIDQRLGMEVKIMERMMEHGVDYGTVVDRVVGKLYQNAVDWRYFNGSQAPFDISGMSTFVQNMHNKRRDTDLESVWDLYNWGTEVMKPELERLENLTEANRLYADFLCEEFGIEREDLFTEVEVVND